MSLNRIFEGGNINDDNNQKPSPFTDKEKLTDAYISLQPTGVIGLNNVMNIKNNNKSSTTQSKYVEQNMNKYVSGDDACIPTQITMNSSEHFGNNYKIIPNDKLINDFIQIYVLISLLIFIIIIINKK